MKAPWRDLSKGGQGFLPAGSHKCIIESVTPEPWKDGEFKWVVRLVCVDENENKGKEISDHLFMAGKALWKAAALAKAAGLDLDNDADLAPEMLRGKVVMANCAEEEYEGKTRVKVQEYGDGEIPF